MQSNKTRGGSKGIKTGKPMHLPPLPYNPCRIKTCQTTYYLEFETTAIYETSACASTQRLVKCCEKVYLYRNYLSFDFLWGNRYGRNT